MEQVKRIIESTEEFTSIPQLIVGKSYYIKTSREMWSRVKIVDRNSRVLVITWRTGERLDARVVLIRMIIEAKCYEG